MGSGWAEGDPVDGESEKLLARTPGVVYNEWRPAAIGLAREAEEQGTIILGVIIF